MKKIFFGISLSIGCLLSAQNNTQLMKNSLSQYPEPTFYTTIDGKEIAYTKSGKGKPTLIFIHGLSSNADAWSKNVAELQKYYTCIAIDLPGYGRSSKDFETFTPTSFSNTVDGLMTKLKINKAVIVGHSMGGQTAIKFALNHPEKTQKLILIAPAGIEEFSAIDAMMMTAVMTSKTIGATTDEQIAKNYELNFYHMPPEVEHMINDRVKIKNTDDFNQHTIAIEKSVKGMLDDKVIQDLDKLKMPTLVLFAKNDKLIPNPYLHANLKIEDVAKSAEEKLRNSEVKIIPEAGHFLQYEKPKEVNQEIKTFVDRK